jgi:serine/threonine protein kinase
MENSDAFDWRLRSVMNSSDEQEKRACIRQMVEAVSWLHSRGFMHGKMMLESFVRGADGTVKLIPLKACESTARRFNAHEKHWRRGPAADVRSLGGLIWALFEGDPLYDGQVRFEVEAGVGFQHLPYDLETLVHRMLNVCPSERPTVAEVANALEWNEQGLTVPFTEGAF